MFDKITITLKHEVLTKLNTCIDFDLPKVPTKPLRSYISLLSFVLKKLTKKEASTVGRTKPIKIKLEYFEAFALERTLEVVLVKSPDRELQNVLDQLNQSLA